MSRPVLSSAIRALAAEDSRVTSPLARAIDGGIRMMGDLASPPPEVTSGALEGALRGELHRVALLDLPVAARATEPPAAAAVLTACAHLASGAYEDAYFALLTARDLIS